jgi:drug/metabolite transporter (DMT)-like permease
MTANQRGIAAVCGCMASYTVNDVLVKQILRDYPVGEVIFVRGLMCIALIGAVLLITGGAKHLRPSMTGNMAIRSAADGLSTLGFIAALAHMPLANLAAVLQIAPLIITALSVWFFREVVGWRRWTAIGIGFVGAMLVIKPVPSEFNIWAIVGAISALFAALREIQTRRIGRGMPVIVVAFWAAVGIMICGLAFVATENWRMFSWPDLVQLSVAATFVGLAIYLLALGFRDVDMSVVSPFRYTYLITSAVGGYMVFREFPDGLTVFGALLIVASGIYTLHREALRRRALTAKARTAA